MMAGPTADCVETHTYTTRFAQFGKRECAADTR